VFSQYSWSDQVTDFARSSLAINLSSYWNPFKLWGIRQRIPVQSRGSYESRKEVCCLVIDWRRHEKKRRLWSLTKVQEGRQKNSCTRDTYCCKRSQRLSKCSLLCYFLYVYVVCDSRTNKTWSSQSSLPVTTQSFHFMTVNLFALQSTETILLLRLFINKVIVSVTSSTVF
jgi:hypothetical protein